ncbi:hypothetical protein GCM10017779_72120 [Streptomyces capillispiralis]|nr:hypothetical protein GCM10017779_72120 [Streptomyces capillispiralis]
MQVIVAAPGQCRPGCQVQGECERRQLRGGVPFVALLSGSGVVAWGDAEVVLDAAGRLSAR